MFRKIAKNRIKEINAATRFYHKHKKDECELCGCGIGEVALFEVHQIMDSKMVFDGKQITLCHVCLTGKDFIEFWSVVSK